MALKGKVSIVVIAGLALWLPVLSWLTSTGCKAQPEPMLSGKVRVTGTWESTIYLVRPRQFTEIAADYLGQVIDSARIGPDGSFAFQPLSLRPDGELLQLTLKKKGSRFATQLYDQDPRVANYMPLVMAPGEVVRIQAEGDRFQGSADIQGGGPDNRAILSLRDIRLRAFEALRTSVEHLSEDSLLMEKEHAERTYREAIMYFADTTRSLPAALVASRWVAPDGDFERSPEYIVGQCRKWKEAAPAHPFVAQLCVASDTLALPLLVGDPIPDLPMPMADGRTRALKEVLGSKLTLVDFWASWCAPCRRENRTVLGPLFREFSGKGFAIVGYALESSRSAWLAAIEKDQAGWTQASHLSGDSGPVMEALRLRTIPANFLVDGEGRVVAKNLHGEALRRFVEERMK